jgi:hypothetical protein
MASIWAKIGRIVYGGSVTRCIRCILEDWHVDTMNFVRDAFRDDLSLSGGFIADECAALYVGRPTSRCRTTSSSTAGLSEPGWPMHTASEIDIDNFQSDLVVSTYPPAEIIVLHRDGPPPTGSKTVGLIVLLVVSILLFGGGGFYYGPPYHYYGGEPSAFRCLHHL